MKNKKTFLIIVLIFVLIIGGAVLLYQQLGKKVAPQPLSTQSTDQESGESESDTPKKVKAPDFTVYDFDGNEVHLSDYFGKPIVLNFWASWCGPCQGEMPDFHKKYLEHKDDVQFLMINIPDGFRETVDTASAFIAKNGYTFPVFYDTRADAANTFGAYSMPTTFFIDADGYVTTYATGPLNAENLQVGIDMIK